MKRVILKSTAKINLYLDVVGRRSDTYHNIETVFERINLCDDIILEKIPKGIELFCDEPELNNKENLAYKAAEAMLKAQGSGHRAQGSLGVRIRIKKRIPAGAGLGGGSSNAAAVLKGLNKLWDLRLSERRLISLAKGLGADVPFFLSNYTFAVGTGRGDCIREISFKNSKLRLWHVIICPYVSISTAEAYKNFSCYRNELLTKQTGYSKMTQASNARSINSVLSALRKKNLKALSEALHNVFEPYASKKLPIIARIKKTLLDGGAAGASLSGTGSAVYGIVNSYAAAKLLSSFVSRKLKKCRVFVAVTAGGQEDGDYRGEGFSEGFAGQKT